MDRFIGVAPDATILSYKVFSQASITDDDSLIDAFLMAFEAGVCHSQSRTSISTKF
jgi:hypothetical protein